MKIRRVPQTSDSRAVIDFVNKWYRSESENRLTDMIPVEAKSVEKFANTMMTAVGVYIHPWWQCRFDKAATTEEPYYEDQNKVQQIVVFLVRFPS